MKFTRSPGKIERIRPINIVTIQALVSLYFREKLEICVNNFLFKVFDKFMILYLNLNCTLFIIGKHLG